jgi:hypothetical protein
VTGIGTVVGAGTVVEEGNSVVAGGVVVEGLDTVVALGAVVDGAVSLTAGFGLDELLGPLHAEATRARAIPAAAIVDVMRISHSLHGSSLVALTVRRARPAESPAQVSGRPELRQTCSPGAMVAVPLSR